MKKILILLCTFLFLISLNFSSALTIDANYITIYSGEQGRINVEIKNNENFNIEGVSVQIVLGAILPDGTTVSLPFIVIDSSEKYVDDIRENKEDSVSFTLKASTEITPGDYNIPYVVTYFKENDNQEQTQQGAFGLRVSAKTDLDFTVETKEEAIVGRSGKVSLEIINKGLGGLKSFSVEIFPQGFELLSKNKIFVGTIDADDTDLASFDVIYKSTSPTLKAKVTYKDFDNEEHTETVNIPFKVYTEEEALERGIITKSKTGLYLGIIIIILIIWFISRKVKKYRKKKNRGK